MAVFLGFQDLRIHHEQNEAGEKSILPIDVQASDHPYRRHLGGFRSPQDAGDTDTGVTDTGVRSAH